MSKEKWKINEYEELLIRGTLLTTQKQWLVLELRSRLGGGLVSFTGIKEILASAGLAIVRKDTGQEI